MVKRKFISEFGLTMVSGELVMLQQDRLDDVAAMDFSPYIYIICRRNRIGMVPESTKFTIDTIEGEFFVQYGDRKESYKYKCKNNFKTDDLIMDSPYPYTEFAIRGCDGKTYCNGKTAFFLPYIIDESWKLLGMEVLYIGQSYGTEGSRNACERLKSHSTLQNIYAEAITRSPDCDIWLILCEFSETLLCSFDGRCGNYESTMEEDNDHMNNVFESRISEQQRINFTEAALIKYFQPPYNKQYKEKFPSPAHSTYSECYDIDLNMVCVELNTENIGLMIFSESVPQKPIHICDFPLHSREDRVYMFDTDYL